MKPDNELAVVGLLLFCRVCESVSESVFESLAHSVACFSGWIGGLR